MHILIKIILLCLIFQFSTGSVFASSDTYCAKRKLGWHFYCEKEIKPKSSESKPKEETNPLEKLKKIQDKLEYLRAKAVLEPTTDNVVAYMKYQQQQMNLASDFSDVWRRAVWQTPDLDYTLKRPVSTVAKQEWISKRRGRTRTSLESLNDNYGVFFFYRSDCSYCHAYTPILKEFARKYGIKIIGVSMNGEYINGWEEGFINNGQAEKLGLVNTPTPATILYDKRSKEVIPIGFGMLTISELEQRIFTVTKIEVGHDY